MVRLGCGPEPYPRAFLYPTVALTSANALWGFVQLIGPYLAILDVLTGQTSVLIGWCLS